MGSPYLCTLQQALKVGYFTGCALKIRITFIQNYYTWLLERQNFIAKEKLFFIRISSIASFKPFLIVWLWEYCTFSDSSVVSLKSSPWPKRCASEMFVHRARP